MDIDFPFWLTWIVIVSGLICLVDVLFLKPKRRALALADGTESEDYIDQEPVLVEYARSFFPVLLIVLLLRSFLGEPYRIPSESMLPTLEIGDFILVNKYAYGLRLPVIGTKIVDIGDPQPGDVMVFVPPHVDRYFIKRVIGVPGDTVRYANKAVYINGEKLKYELTAELERVDIRSNQAYTIKQYAEQLGDSNHMTYRLPTPRVPIQEWVLQPGEYFMMGDNRDQSEDSRRWGPAFEHQIVGKAVAIWLHKPPGWNWPSFARNRWID